ncbi:molybdopterin-binding protein [soil metagenome]
MRPVVLDAAVLTTISDFSDAVVVEEVRANGRRVFRKGHVLSPDDEQSLRKLDRSIHAVWLEDDELHENEAGTIVARAIAGPGTSMQPPVQSRVNLKAARKGLLRVDQTAVFEINRIPDQGVFTMMDGLAVLPGKTLAGIKITPVATRKRHIEAVQSIAARSPVIEVKPFLPLKVGVVTTEGLNDKSRQRFRDAVLTKTDWYGSHVLGFNECQEDPADVAAAMQTFLDHGADLVMTGGGNAMDPLDAAMQALPLIGATMTRFGAPAHPGSMFWLAHCGSIPIFNLASCSMYSRSTTADLILPWIMAGDLVTSDDISRLGYGGLLDRDMGFRFPPYGESTSNVSAED